MIYARRWQVTIRWVGQLPTVHDTRVATLVCCVAIFWHDKTCDVLSAVCRLPPFGNNVQLSWSYLVVPGHTNLHDAFMILSGHMCKQVY